ncbi:hypothetical protein KFL_016510020 [Klebsormidium nitens]|uniref:Reverse transcriptase Ty1/copia-type domain-containing protein n=1 Tax=Klebsormidium nitens TaxID=105231 RepID=A0A1Y1ISB7_KLENI|nr:hypothetical protein KFL_016510020 [Klebsormidium nitens]|eukprot:GAQ93564.1 hypothetical protein KFL_016510020 [Klebsormidium nitens]
MPTPAARRYPARKRRAPGEWYRANSAADTEAGEHPEGTRQHSESQSCQKQEIDFDEVYSLVSKRTIFRALLAVVAERDLELHQLDVKTAFFNGELEEEIYMQQPQGYEQGGLETVCRLERILYRLRQAPRA